MSNSRHYDKDVDNQSSFGKDETQNNHDRLKLAYGRPKKLFFMQDLLSVMLETQSVSSYSCHDTYVRYLLATHLLPLLI